MRKAAFLDRDGVLNENVYNPATREWESPYRPEDFKLRAGVFEALQLLQKNNFLLFLVSNQPGAAKGKASKQSLLSVQKKFEDLLKQNGVKFQAFYYCYHHPQASVVEFRQLCECRKPGSLFLKQARIDFDLDFSRSWMLGDRLTDMECGRAVNIRTILIQENTISDEAKKKADFIAPNLTTAVRLILEQEVLLTQQEIV